MWGWGSPSGDGDGEEVLPAGLHGDRDGDGAVPGEFPVDISRRERPHLCFFYGNASRRTRYLTPLRSSLSLASHRKTKFPTPPRAVSASPRCAAVCSLHSAATIPCGASISRRVPTPARRHRHPMRRSAPYPSAPPSPAKRRNPPPRYAASRSTDCSSYWTQSLVPHPPPLSSMRMLIDCSGASIPAVPCRAPSSVAPRPGTRRGGHRWSGPGQTHA
jgi:hypothetical protein